MFITPSGRSRGLPTLVEPGARRIRGASGGVAAIRRRIGLVRGRYAYGDVGRLLWNNTRMPVRSSIDRDDSAGVITARRRCLVCEWQQTVDEPENTNPIEPLCPRCHAPTVRTAIVAHREGSA